MRSASRRKILVVIRAGGPGRLLVGVYRPRHTCQYRPHQIARCPKIEGVLVVNATTSHIGQSRHPTRFPIPGGPR